MNNSKKRATRIASGLPTGLSTGNSVVDRIGQMHFEGNILDHRWLSAPKLRYESGKLNVNAALVLADIIYWHRPTLVRDEASGRIIEVRKKFSGSRFWKDYATWAEGLGLTKRQLQDAVSFLDTAGLISREIRPVFVDGVQTNNLPIITPDPDAIAALTYNIPDPDDEENSGTGGVTFKRETPSAQTSSRSLSKIQGVTSKREAPPDSTGDIRENKHRTSEINNNAGAEDVVDLIASLEAANVSPKTAHSLASQDANECRRQLLFLPHRDGVRSRAATLVKAIREQWAPPEKWLQLQESEQRTKNERQARKAEAQRKQTEQEERQTQEAAERERAARLDAEFEKLDAQTQREIADQARQRMGVLGRVGTAQGALMAMRRAIVMERMG